MINEPISQTEAWVHTSAVSLNHRAITYQLQIDRSGSSKSRWHAWVETDDCFTQMNGFGLIFGEVVLCFCGNLLWACLNIPYFARMFLTIHAVPPLSPEMAGWICDWYLHSFSVSQVLSVVMQVNPFFLIFWCMFGPLSFITLFSRASFLRKMGKIEEL